MNIDFANNASFSTYVVLLALAGVMSLTFSSPVLGRASRMLRLVNFAFGIGFIGYAFYLAFLFEGGTYVVFFKAFIVPVVLAVRTIQSIRQMRSQAVPAGPSYAVPVSPPQQPYAAPQGYAPQSDPASPAH